MSGRRNAIRDSTRKGKDSFLKSKNGSSASGIMRFPEETPEEKEIRLRTRRKENQEKLLKNRRDISQRQSIDIKHELNSLSEEELILKYVKKEGDVKVLGALKEVLMSRGFIANEISSLTFTRPSSVEGKSSNEILKMTYASFGLKTEREIAQWKIEKQRDMAKYGTGVHKMFYNSVEPSLGTIGEIEEAQVDFPAQEVMEASSREETPSASVKKENPYHVLEGPQLTEEHPYHVLETPQLTEEHPYHVLEEAQYSNLSDAQEGIGAQSALDYETPIITKK